MARKPKSFWLCVAVVVVSLAGFVASYDREVGWAKDLGNCDLFVKCEHGSIVVSLWPWPGSGGDWEGLYWENFTEAWRWELLWKPGILWSPSGKIIFIPLWIPFVLACVGAFLTYRRAPKPGACLKCAYNLTGNESGVCPECGSRA